jgi:AAA domain
MSIFTEERNPELELSEEDLAIYESLEDPDPDERSSPGLQFEDTNEGQRITLGTLLQELDLCRHYSSQFKPSAFGSKYHQAIAEILWAYVGKYDSLPSSTIVLAEIRAKLKDAKDSDDLLTYLAEVSLCSKAYVRGLDSPEYIKDKLDRFAKRQSIQKAISGTLAALKDPKANLDEVLTMLAAGLKLPARPNAGLKLQSWDELCEVADSQVDDWLIPNWAEFGCLHLITGQPFAGKSTHVGELIALMAQGKDWHGGLPLAQVPIVLLDFENRERTLRDRIRNYLGDNQGRIRELLFRVPSVDLPRPLTTDTIEHVIKLVSDQIGASGADEAPRRGRIEEELVDAVILDLRRELPDDGQHAPGEHLVPPEISLHIEAIRAEPHCIPDRHPRPDARRLHLVALGDHAGPLIAQDADRDARKLLVADPFRRDVEAIGVEVPDGGLRRPHGQSNTMDGRSGQGIRQNSSTCAWG